MVGFGPGGMGVGPDLKARTDLAVRQEKERVKARGAVRQAPERLREQFEGAASADTRDEPNGMLHRLWRARLIRRRFMEGLSKGRVDYAIIQEMYRINARKRRRIVAERTFSEYAHVQPKGPRHPRVTPWSRAWRWIVNHSPRDVFPA